MSELNQSITLSTSEPRPGFRTAVAGFISRAVKRWHRRQAAAALRRLDDGQLEDIGISRNDIPQVVAGLVPSNMETETPNTRISTDAARLLSAARMQ